MEGAERGRVHVIATQHLDVAWLWCRVPEGEELMRQCFERVLEMIEASADDTFVFSRSTPWSFAILEQRYPDLFRRVREHVEKGRIELCGGEWVEADHLIPGGEALVRQFALGQWYFLEKFGKTATVCWSPDIFGHPNTMPQLLRKAGLEGVYFHRFRPRYANGNTMHQCVWEGPDGSTAFVLAGLWGGRPGEDLVRRAAAELQETAFPATHVATGLGSDRRITMQTEWVPLPGQHNENPELPSCGWSSADNVLQDMKTYADQLPVVKGEFGFSGFTGTYTSNLYNKHSNRELEGLLVSAEKAGVLAAPAGFPYPAEQLRQAWRDLCVNQFHDIICGCSYGEVHKEDRCLFEEARRRGQWALDQALAFICHRLHETGGSGDTGEAGYAVFDLLPWARTTPVVFPDEKNEFCSVFQENGEAVPSQRVELLDGREALLVLHSSDQGIGYDIYNLRPEPSSDVNGSGESLVQGWGLDNGLIRVEIDPESGEITRFLDKRNDLECISANGVGNRMEFLEEAPWEKRPPTHSWEPWDIQYTGCELGGGEVEVQVVEEGPVRGKIRVTRQVQLSDDLPETVIMQDIVLYRDSPVLHFETRGQWYARRVMLKASFDLGFECTDVAAEAPYGVAERVPQDKEAQVEKGDADSAAEDGGYTQASPNEPDRYMQKWVDATNGARGVLFLNNGQYGYDAVRTRVRLSLMRSPLMRPELDDVSGLGEFSFAYGVMPHPGNWQTAEAPRRAYEFNEHARVREIRNEVGDLVSQRWWQELAYAPQHVYSNIVQVTGQGILVTAAKQAEDANGIILRILETMGQGTSAVLYFCVDIAWAAECDFLERSVEQESCAVEGSNGMYVDRNEVKFDMGPFEVKTIKVSIENA